MSRALILLFLTALAGCWADLDPPESTNPGSPINLDTAKVDYEPEPPVMARLSSTQYRNALVDLFGPEIAVPAAIEPDVSSAGFIAIGSALASTSLRGVEQYESAAFSIAEQILPEGSVRDHVMSCQPEGVDDEACATEVLGTLGARAWRRPLTGSELDRLVGLSMVAAETLGDLDEGLTYGISAILQSPRFLYRVDAGEVDPDDDSLRRYTNFEMASRLSFFLWNSPPDEALYEAAAQGELTTAEGLEAQALRLLDSERSRAGVLNFFSEMWALYHLDELSKDPMRFPHMSPEVGPSAREETLLGVEHLIFDLDGDYRELFTTYTTFLNRKLAAIYAVPAPAREGFAETQLPEDGHRRGLLGQVSFLALHSHPTGSSPTLRGVFVRETLLCQPIPLPPAGVDTSIPEPSPDLPTMRERIAVHIANPGCASCHNSTDVIGLGLENFDGLGRFRATESDVLIDASGTVDGVEFADAPELAEAIAYHPALPRCLVQSLYRYATGRVNESGESDLLNTLTNRFAHNDYRVKSLLVDIVMSPGFRRPAPPAIDEGGEQ